MFRASASLVYEPQQAAASKAFPCVSRPVEGSCNALRAPRRCWPGVCACPLCSGLFRLSGPLPQARLAAAALAFAQQQAAAHRGPPWVFGPLSKWAPGRVDVDTQERLLKQRPKSRSVQAMAASRSINRGTVLNFPQSGCKRLHEPSSSVERWDSKSDGTEELKMPECVRIADRHEHTVRFLTCFQSCRDARLCLEVFGPSRASMANTMRMYFSAEGRAAKIF